MQTPWSRIDPHPLLTGWAQGSESDRIDTWAAVVGCGLGVDAEYLPGPRFRYRRLEISETDIRLARQR